MAEEISELSHEQLIEEYTATTQHLTICDMEGQLDPQQENEQEALQSEILKRMSKEE